MSSSEKAIQELPGHLSSLFKNLAGSFLIWTQTHSSVKHFERPSPAVTERTAIISLPFLNPGD